MQFGKKFRPYKLGDCIKLKHCNIIYSIQDIRMILYIKETRVEFKVLLLDDSEGTFLK
jgi:hypothetical protein